MKFGRKKSVLLLFVLKEMGDGEYKLFVNATVKKKKKRFRNFCKIKRILRLIEARPFK